MRNITSVDTKFSAGILLYAYAITLGAAYIFSFWRPFGFNIFPFLSLTDFVTVPFNRLSILLAPLVLMVILQFSKAPERPNQRNHKLFYQLIFINLGFSLLEFFRAIPLIFSPGYIYENEKSIFGISIMFYAVAIALLLRFKVDEKQKAFAAVSIMLSHLVMALASGYRDGKTLYEGAEPAYYLQQKELCAPPDYGNWVYLDKFGPNVFFMNTRDKRLCLVNELKFNLVDRKTVEKYGQ